MRILVCVFLLCLYGCASSKKVDPNDISSNEGVIVGNVKVLHEGENITGDCTLIFKNGSEVENYRLSSDGVVALKMPRGRVHLRKLICSLTSPYTHLIKNAVFKNNSKTQRTYFGNVVINWEVDGGFKLTSLFGGLGAGYEVGKMVSEGSISMDVKSKPLDSIRYYKKKNQWDKNKFAMRIIGVGSSDYSQEF